MPDQHWPRFNRLQQRRSTIRSAVDDLDDRTLTELLRVAGESSRPLEEGAGEAVSDGFPASSVGGGHASDDVSRPTENSALRYYRIDERGRFLGWVEPIDAVGQACAELFAQLAEAEGLMNKVARRRDYVIEFLLKDKATMHGRVSSLQGDCEACGHAASGLPNDRIKSGFCHATPNWCYQVWLRAGRPERAPWIAARRKALAAEAAARNAHREQTAER